MISRGVEISIAGGGGEMVGGLSLSQFFFSLFFFNHTFIVSRYKKAHAALAMEKTKPINSNPPPASPPHGKNQSPRVHRKSLPAEHLR